MKIQRPIILLMLAAMPLNALAGGDAGLPGEFLSFGSGPRALGMGHAFTAVADDVDALHWNPAGLATFRSSQVAFQHAPLEIDGAAQYIAYAQPLYAMGSLGVGIVNLGSPDIPRIDANNAEVGSFDARETGYLAGYAQRLGDRLSVGGTAKMARKTIDGRGESGFGADAGVLYRMNERMSFGVMAQNLLAPTYGYESDKEEFPRILRFGTAARFFRRHLTTALDIEKTIGTPQGWRYHFGVEGFVIENVFLRAGLNRSEVTAGLGLRWRNVQFDYGVGFQPLGLQNRFGVKMFFGGYEVDAKASPRVFSPVGLTNKTTIKVRTTHRDRIVKWIMTIRDARGEAVQSFQGFNAPPDVLEWDGRNSQGQVVPAGRYTYRLMITDSKDRTEMTPVRDLKIVAPTPFEIEAK